MNILENIPVDFEKVISEIERRQGLSWNNGRINESDEFPEIEKLFQIINSGIGLEDFFYKGDLFRIHCRHTTIKDRVDSEREKIIEKMSKDSSCSVLPITEYSNKLVAFSKNYMRNMKRPINN